MKQFQDELEPLLGKRGWLGLRALLPQLLDKADVKKLIESLAQAGLMAYGTGVEGQE
ncbi:hypothetical protein [Candidatus Williamhamiltonella defendens]|uniref:hypothetical protein n=1 Tax=Candidatus Williamhamiltonella defendens TaxID=138072 RepID=UPI0015816F36|nr:hypothetical protein [Candidatus Hamiltonella defensa]